MAYLPKDLQTRDDLTIAQVNRITALRSEKSAIKKTFLANLAEMKETKDIAVAALEAKEAAILNPPADDA